MLSTETPRQAGYNEAANDLATVLVELRRSHRSGSECVDTGALISRFEELKKIRFAQSQEISPEELKNFLYERS